MDISRPPRGGRGLKQYLPDRQLDYLPSPPARGAWIETAEQLISTGGYLVAPRAGGVD